MNNTQKAQQLNGVAIALAPSLQRYDFSDKTHIKQWADITFEAAKEFTDRIIANYEAGAAKDDAEAQAAKAVREKAQADQLAKDAEHHAAVKAVIQESQQGETT